MTRGRPKRNTLPVKIHLSLELMSRIRLEHPELLKPDRPGEFRHGALAKFIEQSLWKEIRKVTPKFSA